MNTKHGRALVASGTLLLCLTAVTAIVGAPGAGAAQTRTTMAHTVVPASMRQHPVRGPWPRPAGSASRWCCSCETRPAPRRSSKR